MPYHIKGTERRTGNPVDYVSKATSEPLARKSAEAMEIDVIGIDEVAFPEADLNPARISAANIRARDSGRPSSRPLWAFVGAAVLLLGLVGSLYSGFQMRRLIKAHAEARTRI